MTPVVKFYTVELGTKFDPVNSTPKMYIDGVEKVPTQTINSVTSGVEYSMSDYYYVTVPENAAYVIMYTLGENDFVWVFVDSNYKYVESKAYRIMDSQNYVELSYDGNIEYSSGGGEIK